ncbi:MAG: hypothetical protein KJ063_18820 [Anaerolineae bacterium]|nr:hypothetical protein [Anaerolineae bacterium]
MAKRKKTILLAAAAPSPPQLDFLLAQWVERLLFLTIPLCLLAFALHTVVAYDLWWQLKTGEWIVTNGIPRTDPFSYAFADQPWIEMRWLFTLLLFGLFQVGGINWLILAKAAILLVAFALFLWLRPGVPRWVVISAMLLTLAAAHNRFFVRPELISYLFLPLFLLCLMRYRQDGRLGWLIGLPLGQIIWTNSHTLFILGPVLLWLFVGAEGLWLWLRPRLPRSLTAQAFALSTRWWGQVSLTAVIVSLVCFLNPYGLQGVLFPLQLLRQIGPGHNFTFLIDEFRPILQFAGLNLTFVSFILLLVLSGGSFALNKRRWPVSLGMIWLAFLYLAFLAVRNLPLFAFVAGFALLLNLADAVEDGVIAAATIPYLAWGSRLAAAIFTLIMIPLLVTNAYYRSGERQFGLGVTNERFPILALSFIQEHNLPGPILHNLGDGGYVLFALGEKSVFTDGRLEVYQPEQVMAAINLFQTGTDVPQVADQFGSNLILLRHGQDRAVLLALLDRADWVPVYYDHLYVLYLRYTAEASSLVVDWHNPRPISAHWPEWYRPNRLGAWFPTVYDPAVPVGLGQLFVTVGNLSAAQELLEPVVKRLPNDAAANLYLGVVYRASGQEVLAEERFNQIPPATLAQPGFHLFAADIYERAGNFAAAYDAYCETIRLAGPWTAAVQGAERSAAALNREPGC